MRIKFKFIFMALIIVVSVFAFSACDTNKGNDKLVWTNDKAVYAYVKAGYENEILSDVEGAFNSLRFQKVYVTEKNVNSFTPLVLLFVLEEDEIKNKDELLDKLKRDERVYYVGVCRDLHFDTVGSLYLESENDTVKVGETIRVTVKGSVDVYRQPFDFGGLYVKPKHGEYSEDTFNGINLISVKEQSNGWLYLQLKEESYFGVIKALDILSRLETIESVEADRSKVTLDPPPIWTVSDPTVLELEINESDYGTVVVRGIKQGKATVEFTGTISARCEILIK